jgi:hypothetical protein
MGRWSVCPGSIAASDGLPDNPSEPAQRGTAAHTLGEWAITEQRVTAERIGEIIENDDGSKFEVTEQMAADVQGYVDLCNELAGKMEIPETYVEQRVFAMGGEGDEYGVNGTADFMAVDELGSHMEIVDYKNGVSPVQALNNLQQATYGLGAMLRFPWIATIGINIFQPNAKDLHKNGAHRRWEVTRKELLVWLAEVLEPAVAAARADDAPRVAGDHCRWCPALALCDEPRRHASTSARISFDPASVQVAGKAAVELPAVESLSLSDVGAILDYLPMLEQWAKAVKGRAMSDLYAGADVPGWKAVEGKRSHKWSDAKAAAEKLVELIGDDAYERKPLTVAAARKALKKIEGAEVIEALVTTTRSKSMAPTTDDRPPALTVTAKAKDVFDAC